MSIIWTTERAVSTADLLKAMRADVAARRLPPIVYEALIPLGKKLSTELVIFDPKGRIWMIRLPTLNENPAEPFPGQWHVPGVTHASEETFEAAWARLIKSEVGENALLAGVAEIVRRDIAEPLRGMYTAFIHVAHLADGEIIRHGQAGFFSRTSLPQPLVHHHEHTIIPEALKYYASM